MAEADKDELPLGSRTERLAKARKLYEAGVSVDTLATVFKVRPFTIDRAIAAEGWTVTEEAVVLFDLAANLHVRGRDCALTRKWAKSGEGPASKIVLSPEESASLLEELNTPGLTVSERGHQYKALMARLAVRIPVLMLQLDDPELLSNAERLTKLDALARKALDLDESGGPKQIDERGRTVVNVMTAVSGGAGALPPIISGEAGAHLPTEAPTINLPAPPPLLP